MRLSTLKARGLRDAIKNGKTVEDLCSKYQCTPNELFDQIGRIYVHDDKKVRGMINDLETNGKKSRKSALTIEKIEEIIEGEEGESVFVDEVIIVDEVATKTADEAVADAMNNLEELRLVETRQSQEVMNLEAEHKALTSKRRDYLRQLREISVVIKQIRADFRQKCDEFDEIASECNKLGDQMNGISAKRREKLVTLEETRQKIEELSILTILVYDDGEINISDDKVALPDDAESKSLYDELLDKPECEELKIREIKTLAKMLVIARNSSLEVEIICDNEALEEAYRKLILA